MTPLLPPRLWTQVMHFLGELSLAHAHRLLSTCTSMRIDKAVAMLVQVVVHAQRCPCELEAPAWLRHSQCVTLNASPSMITPVQVDLLRALPPLHTVSAVTYVGMPCGGSPIR